MIILLKRDAIARTGNEVIQQKVFTKCELPKKLEVRDFGAIVAEENIPERNNYSRAAVIRHHGSQPTSGHCTTLASREGSDWAVFDDETVRLPTTEDGEDFSEKNWRCAAYTASNPNKTEPFEFDPVLLVRNGQQQKFQLQNFYSCCSVHWKRSVGRIMRNHLLVPPDEISQNRFRHLVNILASEKTNEERFHQTISDLKTEFPHVTGWIDWYLDNNRGNCFFPFMTQGGISGFGNNTNAQECSGRWLQDALGRKKEPMCEVLQHLYAAGKAINEDVKAAREGNATSYQRRRTTMTPIQRDMERKENKSKYRASAAKKRKAKMNETLDYRAPDTTEQLFTPPPPKKKQRRARVKPPGNFPVNEFAMPWSYNYKGKHVTNTCAMDSFLQNLFLMRKYSVIPQHLFAMDEVLTDVLNLIDARQFDEARHKWLHHVMEACGIKPDIRDGGRTWSLFGKTCPHSLSCKLFQMTIRHRFDSCSMGGECPNESLYDNTNSASMANMVHRISCLDVSRVTGDAPRYDEIQDLFECEYHTFQRKRQNRADVARGEPCGNSIELFKEEKKKGCNGRRKKRQEIVDHPIILELYIYGDHEDMWSSPREIPQSFTLCGKEYIFCGALLRDRDNIHFRALAKIAGKYAMYDGMHRNPIKWHRESDRFGGNFGVGKAWYTQRKSANSTELQTLSHDVKIGIADGISIRFALNNHTRHEDCCQHCNGNQGDQPQIILKEKTEDGMTNVSYYHIAKDCMVEKIKSMSVDVLAAIENSEFPEDGQVMLRKKVTSLLYDMDTDEDDSHSGSDSDSDSDSNGGGGGGSGTSLRKNTTGSLESSIAEKSGVLRVGDRIRYNPYFPGLSNGRPVEGNVTKIKLDGIFGYPSVDVDAEMVCSLDYESNSFFQLINSDHDDAPPNGIWSCLQKVDLEEGRLDDTSMKERRERVAEETIQRTPGGVEKLGLLTSVDSARKQKLPTNVHLTRSVAREQGIKIEGFYK